MVERKEIAVNTTVAPAGENSTATPVTRQGFFQPLIHFIREVMVELKKTRWPTRNDLTKFTIVVITTIVVVAIFLFVADWVAAKLTGYLYGIGATGQ